MTGQVADPSAAAVRTFGYLTAVVAVTLGMTFLPTSGAAAAFLVYAAAMPVAIEARTPAIRGLAVVTAVLAGLASFLLLTVGLPLLTAGF